MKNRLGIILKVWAFAFLSGQSFMKGQSIADIQRSLDNGQPGNEVSVVLINGYDGYYPANGLSLN